MHQTAITGHALLADLLNCKKKMRLCEEVLRVEIFPYVRGRQADKDLTIL